MSVVLAITTKNGEIVLAADKRATIGDPNGPVCVDDTCIKIATFDSGAVAMVGMVGHVAIPIATAMDQIKARTYVDPLDTVRVTLTDYYDKYWPYSNKSEGKPRPDASIIYADIQRGKTRVCMLDSDYNFAPRLMTPGFQVAGMHQHAMYFRKRLWRNDLDLDEATRLAVFMVHETSMMEVKVGPDPLIVHITNSNVIEIPQERVNKLIEENNERYAAFARSLVGPSN